MNTSETTASIDPSTIKVANAAASSPAKPLQSDLLPLQAGVKSKTVAGKLAAVRALREPVQAMETEALDASQNFSAALTASPSNDVLMAQASITLTYPRHKVGKAREHYKGTPSWATST